MIAGLTAAEGGSVAVQPASSCEPFPRPRLRFLDPVGLALVIEGDLVQRRGDVRHAAADRQGAAFVGEGAQ